MKLLIKKLYKKIERYFILFRNKRDYNGQEQKYLNERALEFSYLFNQISHLWPRTAIDVGTGMSPLPAMLQNCGILTSAIDNIEDYWENDMLNKHFWVKNEDITCLVNNQKYDLVCCISVLEHINDHDKALKGLTSLLKDTNSRLILTFPYTEDSYCSNVYEEELSAVTQKFTFKTQSFSRKNIDTWIKVNNLKIYDQHYWRYFSGKYWTCGDRLNKPIISSKDNVHQLSFITLGMID